MRIITNTNIIVDDFQYCKHFPKNTFIHFLTHFHADHWVGMTEAWDYGPIYCSSLTKKLILNSFPKIPNIIELSLNTKHTLILNNNINLKVDVYLFDANHIPGSAMILFQGYMGTILHTGDFRFINEMITENPILYPPEKVQNSKDFAKCSIHIDELIFDNTYCDPLYKFPTRDIATKQIIEIIEKNKGKRVLISMGTLGKEQIVTTLAHHFKTKVLISEKKYKQLEIMGLKTEMLTITPYESWIEIVSKKQRLTRLDKEKQAGNTDFIMIDADFSVIEEDTSVSDGINYLVPYSQHSNFCELDKFIKSIQPCILKKLVLPYLNLPMFKNRVINNLAIYLGYLENLQKNGKSAFRDFLKRYTHIGNLSENYKKWMTLDNQAKLFNDLGIIKKDFKMISFHNHNEKNKKDKLFKKKEKMLGTINNHSLFSITSKKLRTNKDGFYSNDSKKENSNNNNNNLCELSMTIRNLSHTQGILSSNNEPSNEYKRLDPENDDDLAKLLNAFMHK